MLNEKITKISQVTPEVTFFLKDLGFTNYMIIKMFKVYGDSIIQLILDNPYFLLHDFSSIGFKKVDQIAEKLGFLRDCNFRVEAGIKFVLNYYISQGNTYIKYDKLITDSVNFLGINKDKVIDSITDLAVAGIIKIEKINDEVNVYFYPYFNAEKKVANRLYDLSLNIKPLAIRNSIDNLIKAYEAEKEITLSDNQKLAIKHSLEYSVSVITGGPGTGKTTIIDCISYILDSANIKYILSAPTGRASKRIMEATKRYALTVHRMLGYSYNEETDRMYFSVNHESPLNYNVIIVDESSMLDIMIMSALVDAIKNGSRLILVGDSNQLPSVGAGNVLSDIIDSDLFNVTKLNKIYRQGEESKIIEGAYYINRGEEISIDNIKITDKEWDSDLVLLEERAQEDILKDIIKISNNFDNNKVQVLTPSKKGTLGSENLNIKLQEVFNPKDENKEELSFGKRVFRINDRVMQIKNNYKIEYITTKDSAFFRANNPLKCFDEADTSAKGQGVFNGEIGIVCQIDTEEKTLVCLFDDERFVKYEYTDLEELDLSYAITIHKAQGSEFPITIIPVTWFPPVLSTKSLIYTGITRGKEKVILIGEKKYVDMMIQNDRSSDRNSGLKNKLLSLV